MIRRLSATIAWILCAYTVGAQTILPVKEWVTQSALPFVLYISGDGGFNDFSTRLCSAVAQAGYSITAVNAKSYFWNKKTPEQTVADLSAYLEKQFHSRKNQQLVLVGYSFGADVMPFIANRLSSAFKEKLLSVILLCPSPYTDFEVHWADLFNNGKKRSMNVAAEINKMTVRKTVVLFGKKEVNFPVNEIKQGNYTVKYLPGGHNFNGNTVAVAETMIPFFR